MRARRLLPLSPLLFLLIGLLDSAKLAEHVRHGQEAALAVMSLAWLVLYRRASVRLRRLLLLGLLPATVGELIFSPGLGMYIYRLHSVPLYVPLGHTLLYATVFLFVRLGVVRRHPKLVLGSLMVVAVIYTLGWWRVANDQYGLICAGAFVLLLMVARGARLFLVAMYLMVAYLEQCGTHLGCWTWPGTLLGRISTVPSGNPPSGVAVFYGLFDLSCLALYFGVHWKSFERWVQRLVWSRQRALVR
jgi:hypothetical protein